MKPVFASTWPCRKKKSKQAWAGSGDKGLAGQFASLTGAGLESEFIGYDCLVATQPHCRIA